MSILSLTMEEKEELLQKRDAKVGFLTTTVAA